jgi:glycosyltransferase involved in cell wall biosynthesis
VLTIPLTITARDEERAIGACLDSLLAAVAVAEREHAVAIDPLVVLDDCTDRTAAIAAARGVRTLASSGGKVEAQRAALRGGAFHIFSDADIVVEPTAIAALCAAMLANEQLAIAMPKKLPLPPRRATPLATALHAYNARRGWSSERAWFSGKLFAIRHWSAPSSRELATRAAGLPASRFYEYAAPLRVDDIYLSRRTVHDHGRDALREVDATIHFRAPESARGMYRYYRRMRRELERIDRLFPELPKQHRTPDLLASAPPDERRAWRVFQLALAGCRLAYRAERFACDRLRMPARDPWPAIAETK